ncbi:uncharacterized protein LOC110876111 [Helianthus annuus]|uniref:uncharacterized protein LOC110876111 n=1 Tax=Helianthus annuus TaxID=4232 RepID=UPI0016532C17|nr:uncharacterized protein LOC110876111 [Helianthus annuus]
MKLNPEKCSFGFEECKFLGHIVGKQSIKANPNKVKVVLETKPPKTKKEVESLNGKLAALKRFTSKLAKRSLPFFKTLKGCTDKKDFKLTEEADEAFNQMKQHLASLPDMAAPETGELISVYLSVAEEAISAVLTIEREKIQAQVLADFIIEVPKQTVTAVNTTTTEPSVLEACKLFTDGASSVEGSGAGLILINPEGLEFTYVLRFDFQTNNNEAEYEALIAGLRLAKEMKVQKLEVFTDSLLVSSQVNNSYVAKEPNMKRYKEKCKELMKTFQTCHIKQIPRSRNKKADALSKLASLIFAHLTKKVLVEVLKAPSIDELEVQDVVTEEDPNWMTPIKKFLKNELPNDQVEAERVKIKARQYVLQGETLYKKGSLAPLLRCVGPEQSQYLIKEIHEDYFTKWPEVKPLAKITGKQVIDFVWENIICRYGLPGVLVTDNGKQLAKKPFSIWCKEYRINQVFSSVAYPQSNGQVERTNRSIVEEWSHRQV